jgi:hypothetical protein
MGAFVTQTARIFYIDAILMKQEIHAGPRRFYPPSLFPTSAAILCFFLQTSFFTTSLSRTISTSLALGAILVVCTFSSTSLRVDFATNCELTASHLLSLFCSETDNFALPVTLKAHRDGTFNMAHRVDSDTTIADFSGAA